MLGLLTTNFANAKGPEFSKCLIPRSTWGIVSLGAPLAPERLGNKENVRLGVIPFRLSDTNSLEFTEVEKSNYLRAASIIKKFSNGKVNIDFVFYQTVDSKFTYQQASNIILQKEIGWNEWDLSRSPFGMVKEIVKTADPILDLSDLDGVILENKSRSFGNLAEALQFFRTPPDLAYFKRGFSAGYSFSFHESIVTNEGFIDNAIILDRHHGIEIIAHEILHNFGLTDLYGGNNSTPAQFSLMASQVLGLLHYEKAVLGWLSLDQIKCANFNDLSAQQLTSNSFVIDNINKDQVIVIKVSDDVANILEVRQEFTTPSLILYELKQESRPPITMMSTGTGIGERLSLSNPESIGSYLKSNHLQVMISDITNGKATLTVIPNSKVGTSEFQELLNQTKLNLERARSEVQAKSDPGNVISKPSNSKKTIVCKKGKKVINVKAKKPKCPAGYTLNK